MNSDPNENNENCEIDHHQSNVLKYFQKQNYENKFNTLQSSGTSFFPYQIIGQQQKVKFEVKDNPFHKVLPPQQQQVTVINNQPKCRKVKIKLAKNEQKILEQKIQIENMKQQMELDQIYINKKSPTPITIFYKKYTSKINELYEIQIDFHYINSAQPKFYLINEFADRFLQSPTQISPQNVSQEFNDKTQCNNFNIKFKFSICDIYSYAHLLIQDNDERNEHQFLVPLVHDVISSDDQVSIDMIDSLKLKYAVSLIVPESGEIVYSAMWYEPTSVQIAVDTRFSEKQQKYAKTNDQRKRQKSNTLIDDQEENNQNILVQFDSYCEVIHPNVLYQVPHDHPTTLYSAKYYNICNFYFDNIINFNLNQNENYFTNLQDNEYEMQNFIRNNFFTEEFKQKTLNFDLYEETQDCPDFYLIVKQDVRLCIILFQSIADRDFAFALFNKMSLNHINKNERSRGYDEFISKFKTYKTYLKQYDILEHNRIQKNLFSINQSKQELYMDQFITLKYNYNQFCSFLVTNDRFHVQGILDVTRYDEEDEYKSVYKEPSVTSALSSAMSVKKNQQNDNKVISNNELKQQTSKRRTHTNYKSSTQASQLSITQSSRSITVQEPTKHQFVPTQFNQFNAFFQVEVWTFNYFYYQRLILHDKLPVQQSVQQEIDAVLDQQQTESMILPEVQLNINNKYKDSGQVFLYKDCIKLQFLDQQYDYLFDQQNDENDDETQEKLETNPFIDFVYFQELRVIFGDWGFLILDFENENTIEVQFQDQYDYLIVKSLFTSK